MGTTQLVWFRHPELPHLAVYLDSDGRLVSLSMRTGKFPPTRWWNPSFGPGLALGGLESDFIAAGLISQSDRTDDGDDHTRVYRAGRVRLEFSDDEFLDPRDNRLPGFRLAVVDMWTGR